MKLTICDLRDECVRALKTRFSGVLNVSIEKRDITTVRADGWATAGNSFGDMGGGIDKAIDQFFDGIAQQAVQDAIRRDYFGELPVGSAVVVRPNPKKHVLIYAPTMRVPGHIQGSINAYLAMRAILAHAMKASLLSLACPTLGTGVGGLMPEDAADQMFQAHRLIIVGEWRNVLHSLQAPYIMRGPDCSDYFDAQ
jgi:O-acetyl-ADP-ribose deacetylase (regulator of RNase III)